MNAFCVPDSSNFVQKQATVRSSVLEVLLEITKYSDLYLMERVLDDESEVSYNSFSSQSCLSFVFFCCYSSLACHSTLIVVIIRYG